jgi:hypothetical protein
MNFDPRVPWYRRFILGDQWPNKTSWNVMQADVAGAWVIVERHTRECTCSYCRGEHGHGLLWLPKDRGCNSWRVLNFFHRLYVRWTLPRLRQQSRLED